MSGLDEDGVRIAYQVIAPGSVTELVIRSGEPSPLAAIGQLLNELGRDGWELVAYDTSTNRGVFKRPMSVSGDAG
jgi:hypothetical protein